MAEKKKEGGGKDKGKAVKKGKSYKAGNVYQTAGGSIKAKNKKCLKCSVFMADHKDRHSCGKCGYTEFK